VLTIKLLYYTVEKKKQKKQKPKQNKKKTKKNSDIRYAYKKTKKTQIQTHENKNLLI